MATRAARGGAGAGAGRMAWRLLLLLLKKSSSSSRESSPAAATGLRKRAGTSGFSRQSSGIAAVSA